MASPTLLPGHAPSDGDSLSHYEPQARRQHFSVMIDGKNYTYGGILGPRAPPEPPTVIEVFDVAAEEWEQKNTSGVLPHGFIGAACEAIGQMMYTFAGGNGQTVFNCIHCLDTRNLNWNEVAPLNPEEAPMCKYGAAMVTYRGTLLVTFSGYGILPQKRRTGVEYIEDPKRNKHGWTNELCYFDLDTKKWTSPETTGSPPPACQGCTLTRIDYHRAITFGGVRLHKLLPNHIHIIDMQSWTWIRTVSSGPGQPWPVARTFHSAVTLYDPDSVASDPALMVWGGGGGDKFLGDGWVYRPNTQQCQKVIIPDHLRGRVMHTTTIVHCDSTRRQLVTYGGIYELPEDDEISSVIPVADTTIMELDCTGPSGDWVVTDVITTSRLGQAREKKDSLPRHVQLSLAEEMRHLTIYERVMREKGKLDLTALQGMMNGPPRVGKSTLLNRLARVKGVRSSDASNSTSDDCDVNSGLNINPSTGVAEKVLQVTVKKATMVLAKAPKPGMIWEVLTLDEEAISLLKGISTSHKPSLGPQSPDLTSAPPLHSEVSITAAASDHRKTTPTQSGDTSETSLSLFRFGKDSTDDVGINAAVIPGFKAPLEMFKDALRNERWADIQSILEGSFTIYFTDVGGQPEFQEIIPALTAGPTVFFLVFNLTDNLNQKYRVQYFVSATEKTKSYESSFALKDVIQQSLASIASTCSYATYTSEKFVPVRPKVIIIGTHKDKASEEQIKAIQQELKQLLEDKDYYRQNMIEFASEDEPAVTVNNLSPDDNDAQKVRAIVDCIASDPCFRIPTPLPWLVLSLLLRFLKVPVITYQQCLSAASECGIRTNEELNEALWFLHTKLGVVRYFRDVPELQDIVILNPQLIFDTVTKLTTETFTFEKAGPFAQKQFQREGIFSAAAIERLTSLSGDLLTCAKTVSLLEHLHILAPVRNDKGEVSEYFLPCVLSHAPPLSPPDTPDPRHSIPPLLVTFRCGYCPKGIFSALIALVLSSVNTFRLIWRLQKDGLSRDRVTFSVGREFHAVSITTHGTHLEVSIWPATRAATIQQRTNPHVICNSVRQSLEQGITTVSKTLHYSCDSAFYFSFYCTHLSCKGRSKHPAKCYDDDPCVMVCGESGPQDLSGLHHVWFGHPMTTIQPQGDDPLATGSWAGSQAGRLAVGEDERPTIQEFQLLIWKNGEEIRIMDEVKPRWREFGIALGFSMSVVSAIEEKGMRNPDRCILSVFEEWSQKKSSTYHWSGLITALNTAGLTDLATRVTAYREQANPTQPDEVRQTLSEEQYIPPKAKRRKV